MCDFDDAFELNTKNKNIFVILLYESGETIIDMHTSM